MQLAPTIPFLRFYRSRISVVKGSSLLFNRPSFLYSFFQQRKITSVALVHPCVPAVILFILFIPIVFRPYVLSVF